MYVIVLPAYMHVYNVCAWYPWRQEECVGLLELGSYRTLGATSVVLGADHGSSERATGALHLRAIN